MRLTVHSTFSRQAQRLDDLALASRAAAADAMGRTLAKTKTAMSRRIRQEFSVKAATVAEYLRVQKPRAARSAGQLAGELYARDPRRRSFNLIRFSARQIKTGVSFRVRREGGRQHLRGAFIANDGRTVFVRVPGTVMDSRRNARRQKGRDGAQHRQKIKAVSTIAVQQMFNARRVHQPVQAGMLAEFQTQLARALSKQAGGSR